MSVPSSFLPITRRGGGRVPDIGEIGAEQGNTAVLLAREHARTLLLATAKLRLRGLKRTQALLPRLFQTTRHEPIVGIDGTISALGKVGGILRSLDAQPPVLEGGLTVDLELLGGGHSCRDLTGSSAAMKARTTAASICTAPIVRQ